MKLMSDVNVHLENKRLSRSFFVFLFLAADGKNPHKVEGIPIAIK